MNAYQKAKEKAREEVMSYQRAFSEDGVIMTYGELAFWNNYFEKLGRRYGLLEEFRAEGICI